MFIDHILAWGMDIQKEILVLKNLAGLKKSLDSYHRTYIYIYIDVYATLCFTLTTSLAFWEDFTCLDVTQCMLNKAILEVLMKYLDSIVSSFCESYLALATEVIIWMRSGHSTLPIYCLYAIKHSYVRYYMLFWIITRTLSHIVIVHGRRASGVRSIWIWLSCPQRSLKKKNIPSYFFR